MDTPTVPPAPLIPVPVAADHPCIKCSYSLRGLLPSAVCPECATPVERSLRGDMLVYSDATHLATLLKGAQMILGSILLIVVVAVVAMALAVAKLVGGILALMPYVQLAVWAVFLFGWWKLTSPDPGQLSTNKGEKPRRLARFSLLVVGAISLLDLLLRSSFPGVGPVMIALTIASYIAMATGFYSGMLYIRWLAPRIPSARAGQRARTLMILIAVIFVMYLIVLVVTVSVTAAALAGRTAPAVMWIGILGALNGLAGLVGLVMYYNLFSWLRTDFKNILALQVAGG